MGLVGYRYLEGELLVGLLRLRQPVKVADSLLRVAGNQGLPVTPVSWF